MSSLRSLISCSALLGMATFMGVMVYAPTDRDPRGLGDYDARFGLSDQAARMRLALANSRDLAAQNIAARTVEFYPDDPEAWLWKIQVDWSTGRPTQAAESARRLESLLQGAPVPSGPLAQSARAYRLGWACWVLSRHDEARSNFLDAAALYEDGSVGFVSEPIRQYNIACYLSMGGETDRAAERFALSVDAGYGGDAGWWQVDPDLSPIRKHPVYLDASLVLERRARERQRERDARRERPDDPFDGAWSPYPVEPGGVPGERPSPGDWRGARTEHPTEPKPEDPAPGGP